MKREPMYKRYSNKKPIGACHFANTFGLLVYEPDDEDVYKCDLITAWCNGDRAWGYHSNKIHYTASGKAYLRKGSIRVYLDEIMRLEV